MGLGDGRVGLGIQGDRGGGGEKGCEKGRGVAMFHGPLRKEVVWTRVMQ